MKPKKIAALTELPKDVTLPATDRNLFAMLSSWEQYRTYEKDQKLQNAALQVAQDKNSIIVKCFGVDFISIFTSWEFAKVSSYNAVKSAIVSLRELLNAANAHIEELLKYWQFNHQNI